MRKIAITDVHGCHLTFKKLLRDVVQLTAEDELYLLGDYVDRGPGSRQVFDAIFELQAKGHKVRCLKGNHEAIFLECINGKGRFPDWLRYGGRMTLDSFDVLHPGEIPEEYVKFMNDLEYFIEIDNYILVHAGLNFMVTDPLKDPSGMMWSRNWEPNVNRNWLDKRCVVYGHTPNTKAQIEASFTVFSQQKLLNIDAGCYGTYIPGYGNLCAFDMTNQILYFQENIDDMSAWKAHSGK